jgi:hypothetical protein
MKTTCSIDQKASLKARIFSSFGRRHRRCSAAPVAREQVNKGSAANELQERFLEIGLPAEMMLNLQITELDLSWDAESQEARDQFLKQGRVLVVNRSCGIAKTYFLGSQIAEAQVA